MNHNWITAETDSSYFSKSRIDHFWKKSLKPDQSLTANCLSAKGSDKCDRSVSGQKQQRTRRGRSLISRDDMTRLETCGFHAKPFTLISILNHTKILNLYGNKFLQKISIYKTMKHKHNEHKLSLKHICLFKIRREFLAHSEGTTLDLRTVAMKVLHCHDRAATLASRYRASDGGTITTYFSVLGTGLKPTTSKSLIIEPIGYM